MSRDEHPNSGRPRRSSISGCMCSRTKPICGRSGLIDRGSSAHEKPLSAASDLPQQLAKIDAKAQRHFEIRTATRTCYPGRRVVSSLPGPNCPMGDLDPAVAKQVSPADLPGKDSRGFKVGNLGKACCQILEVSIAFRRCPAAASPDEARTAQQTAANRTSDGKGISARPPCDPWTRRVNGAGDRSSNEPTLSWKTTCIAPTGAKLATTQGALP